MPFFDYPKEIRKVIYANNAIESLNSSFRKVSRNRNLFPSSEALKHLQEMEYADSKLASSSESFLH
jgi:putative transposase